MTLKEINANIDRVASEDILLVEKLQKGEIEKRIEKFDVYFNTLNKSKKLFRFVGSDWCVAINKSNETILFYSEAINENTDSEKFILNFIKSV